MITKAAPIIALLCSVAAATAGAAPPTAGSSQGAVQRIGDIKLVTSPDAVMTFLPNSRQKSTDFDIRGSSVSVTSPRYDLSAPRIQFSLKNNLIQTGTATGGVHVEVRDPIARQTQSLTCATAVYYGATAKEPAHMHLTGPAGTVHYVLRDPQFEGPADGVCDSADVTFLPDGTNKVEIVHPIGSATPIEPATKAKVK